MGIVGSGGVGVACAWSILLQGLASRVTLYDRRADRAIGEARDFQHAMPLLPRCEVPGAGLDAIEPEDVLVIAVGAHTQPGMTPPRRPRRERQGHGGGRDGDRVRVRSRRSRSWSRAPSTC